MCGGRGFGRTFFDLGGCGGGYDRDDYEPYPRRDTRYGAGIDRDYARLKAEIRTMYASGEIMQQQYYDALDQWERGVFTWDDLLQLQRSSRGLRRAEQKEVHRNSDLTPDQQKETEVLEKQKKQIKEEKERTESVLSNIRDSITKLQEKMALDEQMAKETINSDEDRARNYLRHRQELVEQVTGLEARAKDLKNDSIQLEQAEIRLNAKQLELQALAQRERVIRLAREIRD